jgi:hypothetical protein
MTMHHYTMLPHLVAGGAKHARLLVEADVDGDARNAAMSSYTFTGGPRFPSNHSFFSMD